MIDKDIINNIRNNTNIIDIISEHISLTPKGKNYFGVCPFHDDHSPSMSVSHDKQIYTCFSCGASGNVFTFLTDYLHISFIEAVKICADKLGIKINVKNNDIQVKNKYDYIYEIYNIATKLYHNNIFTKDGKEALKYLNDRNLSIDVIKKFNIGLSSKNKNYLTNILLENNYTYDDMDKSGLVVNNEFGFSDIYYDRIMFPLHDLNGNVIGFSGRLYNNSKEFKYINTKETEIFKKGEILYNYHIAIKEARKNNKVIVMEGFMDVIRASTIGIDNVVATMGTSVTKNQANLIKRLAKEVLLCFDGDKAGIHATNSCIDELLLIGVTPLVIELNDNMDPDDYIKINGADSFLNKINNPISYVDFKLKYYKLDKDLGNSIDVANYINEVMKFVKLINDNTLKEIIINKLSKDLNIEVNFLIKQLKDNKENNNIKIENNDIKILQKNRMNKYEKAEQCLLYYMLKSKEVVSMYNRRLGYLPTAKYRFLARDISLYYKDNDVINIADFITFIEDDNTIRTLGEIEMLNLKEDYDVNTINDYIEVIVEYNIKKQSKRLLEEIKIENDPLKKAQIAEEIKELKMRRDING